MSPPQGLGGRAAPAPSSEHRVMEQAEQIPEKVSRFLELLPLGRLQTPPAF